MESEIIRERLQEYIRLADNKKIAAIYTLVEHEIVNHLNHWEDENFLKEMQGRVDDYESGKAQDLSWEELKNQSRNHQS